MRPLSPILSSPLIKLRKSLIASSASEFRHYVKVSVSVKSRYWNPAASRLVCLKWTRRRDISTLQFKRYLSPFPHLYVCDLSDSTFCKLYHSAKHYSAISLSWTVIKHRPDQRSSSLYTEINIPFAVNSVICLCWPTSVWWSQINVRPHLLTNIIHCHFWCTPLVRAHI